ncbi:hypothetical protein GE09DRAFT_110474 [Coniochaeta sp. 2T2.1]|nr:hypothetical protein GE09DRAFT_110474 [Coniochaeta sp. 2T2.1]
MPPLSRLVPRQCSPMPTLRCTASSSQTLGIFTVTATPNTQCRHRSNARQPPPPPLRTVKAGPPIPTRKPSPSTPSPETLVFTASDVPAPSFFASQLPLLGPPDLTVEQCIAATTLYCDGTTARSPTWAKSLVSSNPTQISPYILHYLALMLIYVNPPNPATHDLGWNMLVTAHQLDYTPSTLQLIIHLEATHPLATRPKEFKPPPPVQSAIARHQLLVRQGKDPSALALQANLLLERGNRKSAAEMFAKAYRLGRDLPKEAPVGNQPRRPRWLLEGATHVVYGKVMLEQGKREEAEAAVRVAAAELDQPQAWAGLAKIAETEEERTECSLRAAMAGIRSACESMSRMAAERALEEGVAEGERRMRGLMAEEWGRLATS